MNKFKKITVLMLAFVLSMTILGGCSTAGNDSKSNTNSGESETLKKIKERGYIVVAGTGTAPFGFIDVDTKQYKGVDAEITTAIAKKLGINKVQFVQATFNSLLLELKNGNCDVVSSAMYITKERQKAALFSNVYYKEGEAILFSQDAGFKSLKDFKNATIAVQQGSGFVKVAEEYVKEGYMKNIQTYPSINDALLALSSKKVDAVMVDNVAIAYKLSQDKSIKAKMLSPYEMKYSGMIGAALPLDDKKFASEWNKALDELKEDGTVMKILKKYGLTEEYFVGVKEGQTVNP
ncbi:MAG: ABC transporter substrate-binding protein [Clostridium sp.]|jgi:polar amino acid transport system substrate-binding protein|uniref:substrate-binding periplasmic protein n=1 Tax=Clostridium sp. TaxID=1506 RepID=UPI0025BAD2E1|nr:ABC transporter substrate-binding protein [Clostridium sp.]MCH3963970.1 ABC transporter substrate-binding protein [Clostridium sp.]MCI1716171.1 ABC transporter substrate-binding protein [Clostridium sp.]MCI1800589.1 ABC transporter substrate-binding protein [Clostridium sp.]MCI1814348.1 ABC transporter substrate-binding protein [Clostridium sp.]MCI1871247.1 ABC transporter substrate-binding protein [Clostridium sp.]